MAKKAVARKVTWYCKELKTGEKGCNIGVHHSKVNPNAEVDKRKSMFCKTERAHTIHQYKETKS